MEKIKSMKFRGKYLVLNRNGKAELLETKEELKELQKDKNRVKSYY
jgi:hypothetical protein